MSRSSTRCFSNAIEKAQEKIEFNNFGIRKNLLDYDQVNNEQREIIYEERRQVLDGENMRDAIYKMITDIVDSMTDMCFSDDMDSSEWDLNEFNTAITPIIPIHPLTAEKVKGHKKDEIKHIVKEEAVKLYEAKEAEFPEPEQLRELERVVLLKCIDSKWMDHIDDMEMLRQGIGLMAYGQRDPVVEYKMNAFEMFNSMISSIQEDTVRMLYHVHVEQKIEREQVAKVTGTNKDDSAGPERNRFSEKKIKYTRMIRAHAEAARNTNSAADVRLPRSENKDKNSLTRMMRWGYFFWNFCYTGIECSEY